MPKNEQGVFPNRYQLIPRVLIFILKADKILLLKGAPAKRLWAGRYNGIGGHVERGEDLLTAARRELHEEAGLDVQHLWLCGTLLVDTGENTGIGIFIFKGDYRGGELKPSEEGSLEWISPAELEHLPKVEDLPILLARVLQWQPGQPAFSARSYYDESEQLRVKFSPEQLNS